MRDGSQNGLKSRIRCRGIGALNGVWWSKNIIRNRKKMIYNSMVKSVLIYGAETWSLCEDDRRRRIDATEMDALRRSARDSKLDRKTNEYIRGKMDAQDMTLDDISRKKNLFGMLMSREWTQRDYQELWFSGNLKEGNNKAVPGEPGKMEYIQLWMKEI